MTTGIVSAFLYFVLAAVMIAKGWPREFRAFLFLPAFNSALGLLQARTGT